MKTRSLSILFTIATATLMHGNDTARLDRVERDISELSLLFRQLSAKVEKRFSSESKPTTPIQSSTATHLVRTGETYWGIARKYGVSVRALCQANPRINAKRLPIGQHLKLPGSYSGNSSKSSSLTSYTVRKGDTLGHIAQRHRISLNALISNNSGIDPRRMPIGKVLQIPSQTTPKDTPQKDPVESTPPSRPIEDLPPLPELPSTPPTIAPEPEVPPISVEERTPPPTVAEKPDNVVSPSTPELDLLTPEATDLIVIDENSRLTDIANRYLTDVATLNKLNNVELAPDQMIKSGSQLYIPRD